MCSLVTPTVAFKPEDMAKLVDALEHGVRATLSCISPDGLHGSGATAGGPASTGCRPTPHADEHAPGPLWMRAPQPARSSFQLMVTPDRAHLPPEKNSLALPTDASPVLPCPAQASGCPPTAAPP